MGCNYSLPNGMGFISNEWTATAFHYVRMTAHNRPFFFRLMENVSLKPASQSWPHGGLGGSWLRSEATCVHHRTGQTWPREGGRRRGLCGFYFAAFCPETFRMLGQVVLIWPSVGARYSRISRASVMARDAGQDAEAGGCQVGWRCRSQRAWQGLAILCNKTVRFQ